MQPRLDVRDSQHKIFPGVMALSAIVGFCQFGSSSHYDSVFCIEEIRRLVVFRNEPETQDADEDCDDSLDDIEPVMCQYPKSSGY